MFQSIGQPYKTAVATLAVGVLAMTLPSCAAPQPDAKKTFPIVSLDRKMVWAHSMMSFPLDLTAVLPYFPKEVGYEAYGAKSPLLQSIDLEKRTGRNFVEFDLEQAKLAGLDGLAVDIFVGEAEYYLKAADAIGGIVIAPCLDLSTVAQEKKEAAAIETVIRNCEIAKRYKSAAKIGDAVLFFTYGTEQLPTEAWERVREAVAKAGHKTYWMVSVDTAGQFVNPKEFPEASVRDTIKPFEAGYLFGNPGDDSQTQNRWRGVQSLFKAINKPFGGGMMPGYFRTGAGYTDAQGTSLYREMWSLHLRQKPMWAAISTWNDYQEATSIGPSSELNFTRPELTRWYSAKFRGEPLGWSSAHLYITTPQTIYPGKTYRVEGLALNPTKKNLTLGVELIDANRRVIGKSPLVQVAPDVEGTSTLSLQLSAVPTGHYLRARAILKEGSTTVSTVLSAPILVLDPVAQPGFNQTIYYSVPAHKSLPESVKLKMNGVPVASPVKSQVDFPATVKVRSVEILQNTALARNFFNKAPYETELPRRDHTGVIPGGTSWGFYVARVVDEQFRVGYSDPTYVAPPANVQIKTRIDFDHANATFAPDTSVYASRMRMEHVALVDDGKGGKAASFNSNPAGWDWHANGPSNLEPYITPNTPLEISMRVRPRAYGGMFFADSGGLWLATNVDGYLDYTRLKPGGGWSTLIGKSKLPLNEWSEIKATWDGKVSRIYVNEVLEGELEAPVAFNSGKRALGYNPYNGTQRYDGNLDDVLIKSLPSRN